MNGALELIRRTRRFRLTLTVALGFGLLFATTYSRGQEPTPDETAAAGEAAPAEAAATGEAAPAEAAEAIAEAPAKPSATDAALPERPGLERSAETLLLGLTELVSKTPAPQAADVPAALRELVVGDADSGLRKKLSSSQPAGSYIHILRKFGFVPAKSFRWLRLERVADAEQAPADRAKPVSDAAQRVALHGIVTLAEKPAPGVPADEWAPRSKFVKIVFEQVGGQWLVAEIVRPSIEEVGGAAVAEAFLAKLAAGDAAGAWADGSVVLQRTRTAEQLAADINGSDIPSATSYKWGDSTDLEGGFKLNGVATLPDGAKISFYAALQETADGLKVLDIQTTTSFFSRIYGGRGDALDITLLVVLVALLLGFLYILYSYGRGLKGSPRELYILFFTKVTEYSAYGAAQLSFMFYLREDMHLTDLAAGSYYSTWSILVTAVTMAVGAVCDAIGIKKTLLIGSFLLLFSRALMPFVDSFWVATLLGFVPLGIGIAITGPVLSVGIKRFTTIEGAALGFGLFYTLMNVGWAVGAQIFDIIRIDMGEMGTVSFLGGSLSTWQVIIGVGFFINLPDLAAILWMRDGVEMTENGIRFPRREKKPAKTDDGRSFIARALDGVRSSASATVKIFADNFVHRAFWVFIGLIGITVFARLTFFHFHITWPSYGIRYFGAGSLVGNIFGVLNPWMIVFLVPVFAYLTRKVRSYWMLLIGTAISVGSIAIVMAPPEAFAWLEHTWFGAIVFDRWLEVPVGYRDPFYLSMVLFVMVFTIGEAIWSPRLMQFTAEIAPPGREGSYISLSYLPYFGAKFIAGPMAGLLLSGYTPEFGIDATYGYYPDHQMIWWWIGGTAALTPLGLFLLKRAYRNAEIRAEEYARQIAAEDAAGAESESEGEPA